MHCSSLHSALGLGLLIWPATVASASNSSFDSDLTWRSNNASLPKVVIYNAHGTILSASNYSRLDNINYAYGRGPSADELIGNVSEVLEVAQLSVLSFEPPKGTRDINSSLYLHVAQLANRHLCTPGSDIAGAVLLHGTNTLEETAIGVDLTVNCSKPFVATGAMRPDSYVSPDGRSNFFQAVAAAVAPESRDRGGLIVLNDRITSIFYTTKTNANTPDTFKALEQGSLGSFLGGQPYYYYDAALPHARPHFDVTNTTELPAVLVLYDHQGFDPALIRAAVALGAKGLIMIGPGAAGLSYGSVDVVGELYKQGIPTVAVPRPVTGTGVPKMSKTEDLFFYAGYLGPEQARVMLQLAINAHYSLDQIRDLFETPLRDAVYGPPANQKWYSSTK